MYKIILTTKFKKDYKRILKRYYEIKKLEQIFSFLIETGTVPPKYKPHKLSGNYIDNMECHIKPDWLLIWIKDDSDKTITMVRTGTHSNLF